MMENFSDILLVKSCKEETEDSKTVSSAYAWIFIMLMPVKHPHSILEMPFKISSIHRLER